MGSFDPDNFGRTNQPLVTSNSLTDVLAKSCVILHIVVWKAKVILFHQKPFLNHKFCNKRK